MSAELYAHLPQRPPFLFVDQILEVEKDKKKILTLKKLLGTEDFFQGHFPQRPIMPGVLLCEAAFQSGAILMDFLKESQESSEKLGVVTRIEGTKFKNFAKPGDELHIEVEVVDQVHNAFFMKGTIRVQGKTIMSTQFTCALVEIPH